MAKKPVLPKNLVDKGAATRRLRIASYNINGITTRLEVLLRWLGGFEAPPRMTFVTHGEPDASDAFRQAIKEKLAWDARVPEHGERVRLS